MKIKIYCTSVIYRKLLDKLPKNIIPLGVGKGVFPGHWLSENRGANISHLNQYYGEHSGVYWVWKNCMSDYNDNDWIGFCHYRKFWLNDIFETKQKYSTDNLYSNLIKDNNSLLKTNNVILIQPIIYKNKNLFQDFFDVHKTNILEYSLNFLNKNLRTEFSNHLKSNILYPLNMFIVRKKYFIEYCENVFPWLEQCLSFSQRNNLLTGYNMRLPSFLSERFMSFWFSRLKDRKCLSYARLGNFFLSDFTNIFMNPLKLPLSFRMYPTIHNY